MATLNLTNNFEFTVNGVTYSGKQGDADSGFTDPYAVDLDGNAHIVPGTLATAAVVTVFDDDDDAPADFDYLFLWADQDVYIQIIGANGNATFKVTAQIPFVLSVDSILTAANTTKITGGSEPALEDIDSIVIGNYSGNEATYVFAALD